MILLGFLVQAHSKIEVLKDYLMILFVESVNKMSEFGSHLPARGSLRLFKSLGSLAICHLLYLRFCLNRCIALDELGFSLVEHSAEVESGNFRGSFCDLCVAALNLNLKRALTLFVSLQLVRVLRDWKVFRTSLIGGCRRET